MLYFSTRKSSLLLIFLMLFFVFLVPISKISAQTLDSDGDGTIDQIDTDDDNDGVLDSNDLYPLDKNNTPINDLGSGGSTQTSTSGNTDTTYTLLAPLTPELSGTYDTTGDCPLGRYLKIIFDLFLGICAVLAMVMIFMGGIEYMGSELISEKKDGINRIKNAIGGLVLALASYLILNELNPKLLNICLGDLPTATIIVDGPQVNSINDLPATPGNIARCKTLPDNQYCKPENLAQYFGDKAEAMSKICSMESGGNPNNTSGTDIGTDNIPFSFGLFQVNLLSNGIYLDRVLGQNSPGCTGLFEITSTGASIPPAKKYITEIAPNKYKYDAKLKSGPDIKARYDACVAKLKDPAINLAVSKKLFDEGIKGWGSMGPWSGDYCACGSAFDQVPASKKCH